MTQNGKPRRRIAGERRTGAVPAAPTGAQGTVLTRNPVERSDDARAEESVETGEKPGETGGAPERVQPPANHKVADPNSRGGKAGALPARAVVVLAVLVVAVVAYDLIFWAKLDQSAAQVQDQRRSAAAATTDVPAQAERAAEQILAYRYDRLQADADAAKDFMTDDYARSYQSTVDDLLAAPASQVKAQVTATVKESGVARSGPGEVDVLLFVNQTSSTTLEPEPQTALNRVVLTMVERDGRWLVDEITAL
jgi:Mce-associated membrane protein